MKTYKIHELVEGVEYEIVENFNIYKIIDGKLNESLNNSAWRESKLLYNNVIKMKFLECEFEPEYNKVYYYPSYLTETGFYYHTWTGNIEDNNVKRNVCVYRTKEQAIHKAKELGWI